MKYKVSFFLWVVGIILMLSGVVSMLLGDKTPTSAIFWIIGAVFVMASIFPTFKSRRKK